MKVAYQFYGGTLKGDRRTVIARLFQSELSNYWVGVYKTHNGDDWEPARITIEDALCGPNRARRLAKIIEEAANLAERWDADPTSIPTQPKEGE